MARTVRYHSSFKRDLAQRVRWLRENHPPEQRARLRAALAAFGSRVAAYPAMGTEVERQGTRSYRVFPIGAGLPYLVWHYSDTADPDGSVWLAMLLHEAQDRERFDPDRFV